MILENLPEFIKQSPIIPLMLSVLLLIIVLLQCMTKHIFYKVRLIFAFLLTFASALFLIFFDELKGWIEKSNGEINIRGYSNLIHKKNFINNILMKVFLCIRKIIDNRCQNVQGAYCPCTCPWTIIKKIIKFNKMG